MREWAAVPPPVGLAMESAPLSVAARSLGDGGEVRPGRAATCDELATGTARATGASGNAAANAPRVSVLHLARRRGLLFAGCDDGSFAVLALTNRRGDAAPSTMGAGDGSTTAARGTEREEQEGTWFEAVAKLDQQKPHQGLGLRLHRFFAAANRDDGGNGGAAASNGRGKKAPVVSWLTALGYDEPSDTLVTGDICGVARMVQRAAGVEQWETASVGGRSTSRELGSMGSSSGAANAAQRRSSIGQGGGRSRAKSTGAALALAPRPAPRERPSSTNERSERSERSGASDRRDARAASHGATPQGHNRHAELGSDESALPQWDKLNLTPDHLFGGLALALEGDEGTSGSSPRRIAFVPPSTTGADTSCTAKTGSARTPASSVAASATAASTTPLHGQALQALQRDDGSGGNGGGGGGAANDDGGPHAHLPCLETSNVFVGRLCIPRYGSASWKCYDPKHPMWDVPRSCTGKVVGYTDPHGNQFGNAPGAKFRRCARVHWGSDKTFCYNIGFEGTYSLTALDEGAGGSIGGEGGGSVGSGSGGSGGGGSAASAGLRAYVGHDGGERDPRLSDHRRRSFALGLDGPSGRASVSSEDDDSQLDYFLPVPADAGQGGQGMSGHDGVGDADRGDSEDDNYTPPRDVNDILDEIDRDVKQLLSNGTSSALQSGGQEEDEEDKK